MDKKRIVMYELNGRYWFSKKFQGIGILFDFDTVLTHPKKTILVFKFKFLFFGCWFDIRK